MNRKAENDKWADWELKEPLSSGATGTVYRACRKGFPDYQSAFKIIETPPDDELTEELRQDGLSDEQIRSHYQRETERIVSGIQRMARFKGMSHLVSIEDFRVEAREDGFGSRVYVRMEYLKPLTAYIADKQLTEMETLRMGTDLCSALEILHGCGILHQDIKPANIFVNDSLPSGVIFKLGDLDEMRDMSEDQGESQVKGTPSYLAPEIPEGRTPDERTDLYALGLTLYQMVNDKRMPFLPERQFSSRHDLDIATQMRLTGTEIPRPARASEAFYGILRKACAFRPEDRYSSAAEMREAMKNLIREEETSQKEKPDKASARKPKDAPHYKRETGKVWKRNAVTAAALILTGVIIAAGIFFIRNRPDTNPGIEYQAGPTETEETLSEDPLISRIQRIEKEARETGVQPDEYGCRIPRSLSCLPSLTELDTFLKAEYGTIPDSERFVPVPFEKNKVYALKTESERKELKLDYQEVTGSMMGWNLKLLLADRANGWYAIRSCNGEGNWQLKWSPPLRVYITAEYNADGELTAIIRGNKRMDAREELPEIPGVEYLP